MFLSLCATHSLSFSLSIYLSLKLLFDCAHKEYWGNCFLCTQGSTLDSTSLLRLGSAGRTHFEIVAYYRKILHTHSHNHTQWCILCVRAHTYKCSFFFFEISEVKANFWRFGLLSFCFVFFLRPAAFFSDICWHEKGVLCERRMFWKQINWELHFWMRCGRGF